MEYAAAAIAPSTRRTYSAAEKKYLTFCTLHRWDPVPASDMTLSCFATHLTHTVRPQSIHVYLAAVRHMHAEFGLPDPTADADLLPRVLRGIKRSIGCAGDHRRTRLPITFAVLRRIADAISQSQHLHQDKLMLKAAVLLAFFGFLRCAEFTSPPTGFDPSAHATKGDITWTPGGPLLFRIKQSKTDPFRNGHTVTIGRAEAPYCPVTAVLAYLVSSGQKEAAPLFQYWSGSPLSRQAFTQEVRRLLLTAGVTNARQYAGHSFRIGAATTAAAAGVPDWMIRAMGRWRSDCVLRYIRTSSHALSQVAHQLCNASI